MDLSLRERLGRRPENKVPEGTSDGAVLRARFEPKSKKIRYQSEFQCLRKMKTDNWADYAEDLRALADKAFRSCKTKQENAWRLTPKCISTSYYIHRLPSVSNRDSQGRWIKLSLPHLIWSSIDLSTKQLTAKMACVDSSEDPGTVAAVTLQDKLTCLVEELLERIEATRDK